MMIVIRSDDARTVAIAGVAGPVRKPVDVDQTDTGFHTLRTLRVYQFEEHSVIEGHAEEDEVYLVLLTGSVDLTIHAAENEKDSSSTSLFAPGSVEVPCAAYLPPGAAYKLIATIESSVAYARAASVRSSAPKILSSRAPEDSSRVNMILESEYAERLRLRILAIQAQNDSVPLSPFQRREHGMEKLLHIASASPGEGRWANATFRAQTAELSAGDTIAAAPDERPGFEFAPGSTSLLLVLMA